VGSARVNAVGAEVDSDLAVSTVEGVAAASLASLTSVDRLKELLDLRAAKSGIIPVATENSSAVAVHTRRVAIVDGTIREASNGSAAGRAHTLVAADATAAIVLETQGARDGGGSDNDKESKGLDHG